MQHLKIFQIEQQGAILIVTPKGEGSAFMYRDLHQEANSIRGLLTRPDVKHLIVNLATLDYFGSEFIGSLVSMLREAKNRGGKSCFCEALPNMLQTIQNMGLFKLWPHFDTRDEALAWVNASPPQG